MNYRIVADSSSNLLSLEGVPFSSVPLQIIVGSNCFTDDASLDLPMMMKTLAAHKGKSSTSCPNASDWIDAFCDADVVFCIALTSQLSGSCASAFAAKQIYEVEHSGRVVYVLDSLSTGPELVLLIEKLSEMIQSETPHEEIYRQLCDYSKRTHLFFSLASVNNFAQNGRISPILAKGIDIFGICIVGRASDKGTLEITNKIRGDKKSIQCIIRHMKELQYAAGRVIIAHNGNEKMAESLKKAIAEEFGAFNGYIHPTRGLCSYYAEPGSVLIGFEA